MALKSVLLVAMSSVASSKEVVQGEWVLAARYGNCDDACAKHGLVCMEGTYPQTMYEATAVGNEVMSAGLETAYATDDTNLCAPSKAVVFTEDGTTDKQIVYSTESRAPCAQAPVEVPGEAMKIKRFCECKPLCSPAKSDTTTSMLYRLEKHQLTKTAESEWEGDWETTAEGYFCVDAAGGVLAATYDFNALWSSDQLFDPVLHEHITPSPTLALGDSGVVDGVWQGPVSYRLSQPYNESAKTCCERKSEENNATSCPWTGSASSKNWHVPVPSECADATVTRVFKLGKGFLS